MVKYKNYIIVLEINYINRLYIKFIKNFKLYLIINSEMNENGSIDFSFIGLGLCYIYSCYNIYTNAIIIYKYIVFYLITFQKFDAVQKWNAVLKQVRIGKVIKRKEISLQNRLLIFFRKISNNILLYQNRFYNILNLDF